MLSMSDIDSELKKDCFECRVTGSLTCIFLGAYVLYNSVPGRFSGGRGHHMFMRVFSGDSSIRAFSSPAMVSPPDQPHPTNVNIAYHLVTLFSQVRLGPCLLVVATTFALPVLLCEHDDRFWQAVTRLSYFFAVLLIVVGFVYISVPLLCFISPHRMQCLIFQNFLQNHHRVYNQFSIHQLNYVTRNFHIVNKRRDPSGQNPILGVWHVLPAKLSEQFKDKSDVGQVELDKLLGEDSNPVVVYFHGNSGDRSKSHRCRLYNTLAKNDFHVVTGDYRGYGDSTGSPTEHGIVRDALTIYDFVNERCKHNPDRKVLIWGHSMGSTIACQVGAALSEAKRPPTCVILESAFNNIASVLLEHPLSGMYSWLPLFKQMVLDPLHWSGLRMESDKHIQRITCPILMLHAEDDVVVPFHLGQKLFEAIPKTNLLAEFVPFDARRGFSHSSIYSAPELPRIL